MPETEPEYTQYLKENMVAGTLVLSFGVISKAPDRASVEVYEWWILKHLREAHSDYKRADKIEELHQRVDQRSHAQVRITKYNQLLDACVQRFNFLKE
jgi:hypothetical protein